MTDDPAAEGFTLIETLVAFLILALSLTIINQAISQVAGNLKTTDITISAVETARRVMATARESKELQSAGVDPATGLQWQWTREVVQRRDASTMLVPFVLVAVTVTSDEDGPQTVLKSIVYGDGS